VHEPTSTGQAVPCGGNERRRVPGECAPIRVTRGGDLEVLKTTVSPTELLDAAAVPQDCLEAPFGGRASGSDQGPGSRRGMAGSTPRTRSSGPESGASVRSDQTSAGHVANLAGWKTPRMVGIYSRGAKAKQGAMPARLERFSSNCTARAGVHEWRSQMILSSVELPECLIQPRTV
jgi:hypothetical protein